MKKVIFKKDTRGFTNLDWLKTYHTFSFGNYYDENRMGFGNLRVLNEDFVQPRNGFGTHTHDNIEIITIPLKGSLLHKDNLGNECLLKYGDIQTLSAGSGLTHSQHNPSESDLSNFLQLWILPDRFNTPPSSMTKNFSFEQDRLTPIVGQDGKTDTLDLKQEARIYMGNFLSGKQIRFQRSSSDNGIFVFVIKGKIKSDREELHERDALGIIDHEETEIEVLENSLFLLMDISMKRKTD